MDYAFFTSNTAQFRRIYYSYIAFIVFLAIFNSFLSISIAQASSPKVVLLDTTLKSTCYRWTDIKTVSSKNASPLPPIFKALKAKATACDESHHFQIVKQFSKSQYIKLPLQGKSLATYCRNVYSVREEREEPTLKLTSFIVREKTSIIKYACVVHGKAYSIDVQKMYFYFEELFDAAKIQRVER